MDRSAGKGGPPVAGDGRLAQQFLDAVIDAFGRQPISFSQQVLRALFNLPVRQTQNLRAKVREPFLRKRFQHSRSEAAHLGPLFDRHQIPDPLRDFDDLPDGSSERAALIPCC